MTNAPGFKSPADVNNALNWLEENGYINKESYRVSERGRPSIFAVFTSIAYNYLGIKGFSGKGNFEHKLYQNLIYQKLTKDRWTVTIEGRMKDSQKLIDVLANSKDKGYVAYEITFHTDNIKSNIIKDIDSGVSKVVIVVRSKKDIKKVDSILDDIPILLPHRNIITVCTISDFLN